MHFFRRQREITGHKRNPQATDVQNNNTGTNLPTNQNDTQLQAHKHANDASTKPRRKSALAEEWEKKFGHS